MVDAVAVSKPCGCDDQRRASAPTGHRKPNPLTVIGGLGWLLDVGIAGYHAVSAGNYVILGIALMQVPIAMVEPVTGRRRRRSGAGQ